MNPELYLSDLEAQPAALATLAGTLAAADPFAALPAGVERVLFLGMGSSRYAAGVAALRLRAAGVDAYAEYASAAASFPRDARTLVVPISATGSSRETLDAVARHGGGASPVAALTNTADSALARAADLVIPMHAGVERGGVSCRTFQHTLALLLALESRLTGSGRDVAALVRRAAEATADLLERRDEWLPLVLELLDGPHGVYTIGPVERLSSAEQSALMLREGPRRPADACETGDWAHVDVYLTKTLDYRALLFPGSRYDEQAMDWVRQRGSTVVTVGGEVKDATAAVRYVHDDDADVALLTETLVAEWWPPTGGRPSDQRTERAVSACSTRVISVDLTAPGSGVGAHEGDVRGEDSASRTSSSTCGKAPSQPLMPDDEGQLGLLEVVDGRETVGQPAGVDQHHRADRAAHQVVPHEPEPVLTRACRTDRGSGHGPARPGRSPSPPWSSTCSG